MGDAVGNVEFELEFGDAMLEVRFCLRSACFMSHAAAMFKPFDALSKRLAVKGRAVKGGISVRLVRICLALARRSDRLRTIHNAS